MGLAVTTLKGMSNMTQGYDPKGESAVFPEGFRDVAEPASPPAVKDDWGARGQEAVMRIPVAVRIVLGATRMPVSKLMGLTRGSIIPLDRKVGDMVDIVVNDRVVARGEVVVLQEENERFAISVREVVRGGDA
ncbi:MAG: FliM/FliN family flagellar motor switch protein [Hyphomicrobiaceae bacterium]